MDEITFILCDPKENLCKEWTRSINEFLMPEQRGSFKVIHGILQDVKDTFDCIVSPANSYAKLDGAMDLVISKMFLHKNPGVIVEHCQEYLYTIYNGYQPTGTCLVIPMHNFPNRHNCRYIAHCPTMRTPSNCKWNKEVVYNCMWSLLSELRIHNRTNKTLSRE